MALGQLCLHQIVGNSFIISSSKCSSTCSQILSSFIALRPNMHTHAPTTRYEHYTQHSYSLHNCASCSDTKSSSCTVCLNYSKSQCRITLKTGVEKRTVNDIAFHGFRGLKCHLFFTRTYYCTSNLSYNTGSTSSDAVWAVKDNGMEFLTEQWQWRPVSKSCLTASHISHYWLFRGGGLPPLIATARQTPFKIS